MNVGVRMNLKDDYSINWKLVYAYEVTFVW